MKKIQPIADATTPAPTLSTQLMSIFASERTALALIVLNAILLLFVLRRVRRAFLAATSGATVISTKPCARPRNSAQFWRNHAAMP